MKKSFTIIWFLGLFLFSCSNCGKNHQISPLIQIKGSDTMVNLVQAWAENFMKKNPSLSVAITGGGSGTGIAALLNNTCHMTMSSRKIEGEELELAKSKKINPKEFIVGLDGIAVVVHPSNPLDKLTFKQISDVFTGKITNWKDLGGKECKIMVISREVNSGTYHYFKEHVLGEKNEYTENALLLISSQAVADEIAQNPRAIGYYGMGYLSPNQKPLAIAKDANSSFVTPTFENVKNGTYHISRPLFFYTNGKPQGVVKKFIDFILSDEGQRIVKEINFVPIR
ncbi:MAG: phosphate ABC transporter substrate-binding protein [bacterium]